MTTTPTPFSELSPQRVVEAIESLGLWLPGEPFALNSYENRVYLVQDDDRKRWVAKFYRPDRLSDEAIGEEHAFLRELDDAGVAVAAPWRNDAGESLHRAGGYRVALFPHLPGQAPELENPDHLFALGELIGRVHEVGRRGEFAHRCRQEPRAMAEQARRTVLESPWLSERQRKAYERISQQLIEALAPPAGVSAPMQRVHGDCHIGNMLGREDRFALVDFDDAMMAPAVQDLWMLFTAQGPEERAMQLSEVIEGYEQVIDFDRQQLALIEPLRALRLMRHSAWVVARWDDPAFPRAFPWVADAGYWDEHIRQLEHQRLALADSERWLAGG
ncbi:serine/threonine protein kinase [Halomonas sp. EF61]|uniref:serine/threonine protein kinase n=1 Tax=unclassified Halomonas TaxID=2609666 RepID=UPI001E0BAE0D|nr:serine/threonine protein kinase [Gammaproteobacteria bacterium]